MADTVADTSLNTSTVAVPTAGGSGAAAKKAGRGKKKSIGGGAKPKVKSSNAKVATHPPTQQMVDASIKFLKERNGSSLAAIKKYMTTTYKIDAQKMAPFIKKYLKSAIESGKLIQTKGKGASGSFKLSAMAKGKSEKVGKSKKVAKVKAPVAAKSPSTKAAPKSPKKSSATKSAAKKPKATVAKKAKKMSEKAKVSEVKKSGVVKAKPTKAKVAAAVKPKVPKAKSVTATKEKKTPVAKKAAGKK